MAGRLESGQADEISQPPELKLNALNGPARVPGRDSLLLEAIEQVGLADHVQVAGLIHGHPFGPGNGFFQAIEATEQGQKR